MFSRVLTFISVFLLSGLALSAQAPLSGETAASGYLIGPGDEVTGKVLGETQWDFVSTVDEDGRIEVPFFDKPVIAKCQTERQLRAEVTKLLSKYLKNPQLSLRVTQRNSRPPVSIYGEVRRPLEKVDLTRKAYLLELISFAGGETEKSGGVVQVFRTRAPICSDSSNANNWAMAAEGTSTVPFRQFSVAELRKGIASANPEIIPGDVIVVQKASPVYVIGEVIKPGELVIPEGGLPLTQAIAQASGTNRDAKTKSVKIYRQKPGTSQTEMMAINYDAIRKGEAKDVMLMPMDVVEVGKSPKGFMDYLIEFATGVPNRIPIAY